MSRVRRRPTARSAGPLTVRQTMYLRLGPSRNTLGAFPDEQAAYDGWLRHRDLLLERSRPGARPWAWWAYELERDAPRSDQQATELARLGLLEAAEIRHFTELAASNQRGEAERGQAVLDAIDHRTRGTRD